MAISFVWTCANNDSIGCVCRWIVLTCVAATSPLIADDGVAFRENFEKAEVGSIPKDFLVLNGAFSVNEEKGNRFLELPGAPVESFGLLFGPTEKQDVAVTARIFSTARGRLYPTFGVGLNGASGFRLQVAPGKRALELWSAETPKSEAPCTWKAGDWTMLRLQVRKLSDKKWIVEGKAWAATDPEPKNWMISLEQNEEPPPGRASIWGSPYAGTPIRFDDLVVTKAAAGN